jgi:hypothetical protein
VTVEDREHVVSRARDLANSGKFSGWFYVQLAMFEANEVSWEANPLNDFFLRGDLDALCFAARKGRQIA